jgi:ribosome maturation factor RimP
LREFIESAVPSATSIGDRGGRSRFGIGVLDFGKRRSGYLVDTDAIERLITPSLEALGYRLVRVLFTSGRGTTLQLMAERHDDDPMTVNDCARISRSVSALFDVADPIAGAYRLEVSSPGVDRPLVAPADYQRFNGREARIELTSPHRGRRRFRGRLLGLSDGVVRLATAAGEQHLPLADVARANLVFVDAAGPQRNRTTSPNRSSQRRRAAGREH